MNPDDLQKNIKWGTIVVLAVIAILFSVLDRSNNLGRFFDFVRNPLTAVSSITTSSIDPVADIANAPLTLSSARAEIEELQARVDTLERENEEMHEIESAFNLLQSLFNRASQAPNIERVMANVIGRDPSAVVQSIIIDRGKGDEVQVGMPVEAARGLVGQMFRTTNDAGQIVLISDTASSIPVRLGSSRATGLLRGGGQGVPMIVDWIDLKYRLEVGEVVLTSGLGGKFPEDIVVGRVSEVDRNEAKLFQRAFVQPAVDFSALEMVFVIINFESVDSDIFTDPSVR